MRKRQRRRQETMCECEENAGMHEFKEQLNKK
jgi:hypothetical protein